jgi:predicted transcriptional regulator
MMIKSKAKHQGIKARKTLALCAIFAGVAGLASGSAFAQDSSTRVYKYTDEASVKDWPALIFESKGRTYFKVERNSPKPRISAVSHCKENIVVDQKEIDGYIVVPSVHENYLLTLPGKQIVSSYTGPKKITATEAPADFAQCAAKAAASVAAAKQVVQAQQVTAVTPEVKKPSPVAPVKKNFAVKLTDGTIYGALQRWSKESGWQLSWEAERDFAVNLEATYEGDYETSIGQLMETLGRSQYPLRACTFDNKVVRVVHKSKSCDE